MTFEEFKTTQSTLSAQMVACRMESAAPSSYRLKKKLDGILVLEGAYQWQEGNAYGHTWREIETVEEKWAEKVPYEVNI